MPPANATAPAQKTRRGPHRSRAGPTITALTPMMNMAHEKAAATVPRLARNSSTSTGRKTGKENTTAYAMATLVNETATNPQPESGRTAAGFSPPSVFIGFAFARLRSVAHPWLAHVPDGPKPLQVNTRDQRDQARAFPAGSGRGRNPYGETSPLWGGRPPWSPIKKKVGPGYQGTQGRRRSR